ncbi:MAG TPA: M14 family zinc carboxypeptidase [Bacteroidales bacterium]|nr:M14 family zinc carboxypeptidase [Bacteroidales bacterium]
MKKTFLLFSFIFLQFLLIAQIQEVYSKVKITIQNPSQAVQLLENGINMENIAILKNQSFTVELSNSEILKLNTLDIPYEVIISNMAEYYQKRNLYISIDSINNMIRNSKTLPTQFHLGSIGGFLSLPEIYSDIHLMAQLYPQLISDTISISNSTTVNGNKIYYVKMESPEHPSIQKPQILLTALTHAREPAGMQQLVYLMWYLLENYNTNPEVKFLVDHLDLYFVPCVNPDGYQFNTNAYPIGGGMWRKNRRNNGNYTWGVDLNRNYGFQWGYDDIGSSVNGNDETYRGSAPFSEVETQQIKLLCESHQFSLAINNHCYGNMLIYPWGHIPQVTPDSILFRTYAKELTAVNHFIYGTCYEVLNYNANGGSSDWFYGEQTTKNKIIEFSPEAGDPLDGFWPSANQILPICANYLPMNLTLLRLALPYPKLEDLNPPTISSTQLNFKFKITSLGNVDQSTFDVSINPISSNITFVGSLLTLSNFQRLESRLDSIPLTLQNGILQGDSVVFEVLIDQGDFTYRDTVVKYYGVLTVLFQDSCNSTIQWTTNGWDVTTLDSYSPPTSFTDSPNGDYMESNQSSIVTTSSVDLSNSIYAHIEFYAKWALETNYDYVQISVSSDNGISWYPLASHHTSVGSTYQDQGNPVYHGFQNEWVHEVVPLTNFLGETIKVKFELISDGALNFDGFYFDDIKIIKIEGINIGVSDHTSNDKVFYVYENQSLIVNLEGDESSSSIRIFDVKGALIFSEELIKTNNIISLASYANGMYVVKLSDNRTFKILKY